MSTKKSALDQDTVRSLFALFEAMRQHMGGLIEASGLALTPVHLRLLDLCESNANCHPSDLVDQMRRDKGQIARMVQELERSGLLERQADPIDARKQIIQVTKSGSQACELFRNLAGELSAVLFAGEERASVKALLALSRRLKQRLDNI